jgi:natural product precursor
MNDLMDISLIEEELNENEMLSIKGGNADPIVVNNGTGCGCVGNND